MATLPESICLSIAPQPMPITFSDNSFPAPDMDDTETLDAYDHCNWSVGTVDRGSGDDWAAFLDAIYVPEENRIHYHVVVDSGSYTGETEREIVDPNNEQEVLGLRKLPESLYYQGLECADGLEMDEEELAETEVRWNKYIDELLAKRISREDEQAILEQSADYFNHYIAGDR